MKYINSLLIIAIASLFFYSCDRDLPYPLDDVRRNGVIIDVYQAEGTSGTIEPGLVEKGNHGIKLTIPKYQGDYSDLDYVQLVCIYTEAKTAANPTPQPVSKIINEKITDIDQVIDLDMKAIYQLYGKTEATLGEELSFTVNVVLKDGYVIKGWDEVGKYNNTAFTSWDMENGRKFSYRAKYVCACGIEIDDLIGRAICVDNSVFYDGESYEVEIIKSSVDNQILVKNFMEEEVPLPVNINFSTLTVTVPKTVLAPTFGQYTNFYVSGSGDLDACDRSFTFEGPTSVDQGSYGNGTWTITMIE